MNRKQAIKVALRELKIRQKYYIFDATLYDMGQRNHHTTKCHLKHLELVQAYNVLEAEIMQGSLWPKGEEKTWGT